MLAEGLLLNMLGLRVKVKRSKSITNAAKTCSIQGRTQKKILGGAILFFQCQSWHCFIRPHGVGLKMAFVRTSWTPKTWCSWQMATQHAQLYKEQKQQQYAWKCVNFSHFT